MEWAHFGPGSENNQKYRNSPFLPWRSRLTQSAGAGLDVPDVGEREVSWERVVPSSKYWSFIGEASWGEKGRK